MINVNPNDYEVGVSEIKGTAANQVQRGLDYKNLSDAAFQKKYGQSKAQWVSTGGKPKGGGLDINPAKIANQVIDTPALQKVASATPLGQAAMAAKSNPIIDNALASVGKTAAQNPAKVLSPAVLAGTAAASAKNDTLSAGQNYIDKAATTGQNYINKAVTTGQDYASQLKDALSKIGLGGLGDLGSMGGSGVGVGGGAQGAGYAGLQAFNPSVAAVTANPTSFTGAQDTSQYTPQQAALLDALTQQAMGQGGPSPAELMLRAQNDAATNQAMALAASQSGRALPAAQRQIQSQAALGAQQAAQQAAIMRAQEQLSAQQQAVGGLQGARQQDLALSQYNQGQQQALALQNAAQKLAASQSTATNQVQTEAQKNQALQALLSSDVNTRGQDITADMEIKKAKIAAIAGAVSGASAAAAKGLVGGA